MAGSFAIRQSKTILTRARTAGHRKSDRSRDDLYHAPNGSGLLVERFELLAWADTAERLIDKLA